VHHILSPRNGNSKYSVPYITLSQLLKNIVLDNWILLTHKKKSGSRQSTVIRHNEIQLWKLHNTTDRYFWFNTGNEQWTWTSSDLLYWTIYFMIWIHNWTNYLFLDTVHQLMFTVKLLTNSRLCNLTQKTSIIICVI